MITAEEMANARATLMMTQTEFAARLGVSPRTVVNWESQGVPERAERKVTMQIGHILEQMRTEAEYNEFLTTPEGREHLEAGYASHMARPLEAGSTYDGASVHARGQGRVMRVADALKDLDTLDLLHELVRRQLDPTNSRFESIRHLYLRTPEEEAAIAEGQRRVRAVQERESVGGGTHDEDFEVSLEDITKKDLDLAAKRGKRKVDQGHAE